MAVLRDAHPDFIAFNYYGGGTVKFVSNEEGLAAKEKAKKIFFNVNKILNGLIDSKELGNSIKKDAINSFNKINTFSFKPGKLKNSGFSTLTIDNVSTKFASNSLKLVIIFSLLEVINLTIL